MPVPAIPGVPPYPTFDDLTRTVTKMRGELVNLLLNLDSLNVVSLTADHIDAGTLNANLVTIRSDLTGGAFVQIDGTGLTINDGTKDTFRADLTGHVTMTGALVQSATGFPRVVMDPAQQLFGAYVDANRYLQMTSFGVSTPLILFFDSTIPSNATIQLTNGSLGITSTFDINIIPGAIGSTVIRGNSISLSPSGNISIPAWSKFISNSEGTTLAQELNNRTDFAYTDHNYGFNLTFDPTTRNLKMFAKDGTQLAIVNIP